ncbi:MAG: hypothetical protein P8181_00310 [bacterium]
MSEAQVTTTPRHLWIVGVVALLWSLIGAMDYLLTQTENEAYMSQFTPEQIEFFYSFPAWLVAFWAIAVWGSVLGSVLLLMRKKLAAPVFAVSFVCMLVTVVYNYGFAGGLEFASGSDLFFSAVVFVVALGLVIYARRMAAKGVLT